MRHFFLVGLVLLNGLPLPVTEFRSVRRWSYPFARPARVAEGDAERLFAEAVERYETSDEAGLKFQIDEACRLWLKQGEPEKAVRARMQLGDLYKKDKRFLESLNQYRQAFVPNGSVTPLTALLYDSIGQIYAELYQPELSLRYYSKALNIARSTKESAIEAQVQLDLATLQGKTGNITQAIGLAEEAVTASGRVADEAMSARALLVLGQMELKGGLFQKSRGHLERAQSLYLRLADRPGQIRSLCLLSSLNLSANESTLARQQAEDALKLAEGQMQAAKTSAQKLRANGLRWPCWLALARALRAAQRREEALRYYFRAVTGTVLDWWMTYASTDRSAVGFSEERQVAYRELVDLLMDLGRTEEAYDAYQSARVRTLTGSIQARRVAPRNGDRVRDNESAGLSAVRVALRTKLLSPALTAVQREEIERELAEVESSLAEAKLRTELNPSGRRMVFSKPANLKQLQKQMSDRNESVLEFDLGEDRSFVWLISARTVDFEILPGRKEIELKLRPYIDRLSKAPPNFHLQTELAKQRSMASDLFSLLLGKLATKLTPNSELIVIPDGLLNYLPFETLVLDGRYLIEDYQITYLPSASLIELLGTASAKAKISAGDQMNLLAFGDPLLRTGAKTIATNRNRPANKLEGDSELWEARAGSLASLPRTRDEVEYIASLMPKERAHLYLGEACTERAFKREKLSEYKWIHFATHSLIDGLSPERSAVVLPSVGDQSEDGLLRAAEIQELELDCDLVVLSACETGRGRLSSGEGIVGLSRAFLIAGARSLVVSQWPVSDISTAQLMKGFYRQLVKGSGTPAALRDAKLSMLRGGMETRHPYYWAPFISIGTP